MTRLYRLLLLLYPPSIRRAYGGEMEEVWRRSVEHARGQGFVAQVGLALRALRDTVVNAPALWARTGMRTIRTGTGWEVGMDALRQDLRFALRGFLRRPGFTAVALFTLALGIGGNTAIFSIVDAAFLDPLPYPEGERVVVVYNSPQPDTRFAAMSEPFFLGLSRSEGAFAALTAFAPTQVNIGGVDRPERVSALRASAGLFDVVGTEPAQGRRFTAGEDVPGRDGVVVISDGLWTRRFGRDPAVVGRTLRVGDREREIVGVMPPGFTFFADGIDLWLPLAVDEAGLGPTSAVNNNRMVVGRLADGVSTERAEVLASEALGSVRERFPDAVRPEHALGLGTYRSWRVGGLRRGLLLLSGAVGFVLLIACANLANLLLVRSESRRREFAVRTALGAETRRMVGQVLTESVVLAVAGAVLGVVVSALALEALRPLAPASIPIPRDGVLDGTVLAFTSGVAVVTGLLFGLAPALTAARSNVRGALSEGGRGASGGPDRPTLRNGLVVGEVALAAVLLVGSGLLVNSLWRLQQVDPGFAWEGRVTADIALPAESYPDEAGVEAFLRPLVDRVAGLPGVESAAVGQWIPLRGSVNWGFEAQDQPDADLRFADYNLVGPGYFDVLEIPVLRGRTLDWRDMREGASVVVVSEGFARTVWPEEDPGSVLGKRINVDIDGRVWREVVGVVGEVRNESLAREPEPMMYFPPLYLPFSSPNSMTLVLRTSASGRVTAAALQDAVRALNPSVPLARVAPLAATVSASEIQRRFFMTLLLAFSGVALVLAGVGLYGVVSYSLSLRTRELGLRMALGADRGALLGMVIRQSGALAVLGVALGLVGAVFMSRLMTTFLYEVEPTDGLTYTLVAAFLLAVAALASWRPAARACGIDPSEALRME